jgi:allophanate hydrolase subunit 2
VDGDPFAEPNAERPLRVVRGPSPAGFEALVANAWRVDSGSDRVGLRLDGDKLPTADHAELLSHGVVFGAIQVPPGGSPIVLLADHQTTGGYPIVAVVISADHARLGQLRPGASIGFAEVSLDEGRSALVRQRAALSRAAAILREDAGWDALWRSAGG